MRKQLARLEAATCLDAQAEARARAIRKAQLWTTLREQLVGNPALVLAVTELEHLDAVSSSSPSFSCRGQPTRSEQHLCFRSRLWPCTRSLTGSRTSSPSTAPDGRPGSSPSATFEKDVPPGFPFIPGVPGHQEVSGKEENKDGRRRSAQWSLSFMLQW